ncbi:MAG: DUF6160 family protein [Thermodesulfobacteriota bacterium]
MKKLFVLAAVLMMLLPVSAMAGMQAASDTELNEVSGQTGITIDMAMSVSAGTIAWGDDNGFAPYTTAGWVVLAGVDLPTIALSNVTIDVGGNTTTTYLAIGTTGNVVTGSLTIADVVIGSSATSTTPSAGEIRISGIGISFGTIMISGHN